MKTTKEVVDALFEIQKEELRTSIFSRYENMLEKYKEKYEGLTYAESRKTANFNSFEAKERAAAKALSTYFDMTDPSTGKKSTNLSASNIMKLKDNAKQIMEKEAEQMFREAIDSFLAKMTTKLEGIFKGRMVSEFKSLGTHSGFAFIKMDDGSSFRIQNTIEYAVSNKGTPFYRYPSRFTDVIMMKDGKLVPMKTPSEAKMKKEF